LHIWGVRQELLRHPFLASLGCVTLTTDPNNSTPIPELQSQHFYQHWHLVGSDGEIGAASQFEDIICSPFERPTSYQTLGKVLSSSSLSGLLARQPRFKNGTRAGRGRVSKSHRIYISGADTTSYLSHTPDAIIHSKDYFGALVVCQNIRIRPFGGNQ
jgi:hypothetical protein